MTSLDAYLRGAYKEDCAFRERLLHTVKEVVPLFYKQSIELVAGENAKQGRGVKVPTWPYAITGAPTAVPDRRKFSASTHCMVLFALDALKARGKEKYSFLLGKNFRPFKLSGGDVDDNRLKSIVDTAREQFFKVIEQHDGSQPPLVISGTYGNDDPFTLTWLTELAFRWDADTECSDATKDAISKAIDRAIAREEILDLKDVKDPFREVTGSFLKLRRLQLALSGARFMPRQLPNFDELWRDFERTIHRQLSYSAIGDAKSDPAELAFAFEGALLLNPHWIGRSLVDQVFEALALSKERQPYWRPITPFLTNDRGQVLFLVSVEVANSILRSCEILDEGEAVPASFSRMEPQLRTYATWLLGEVERISDPQAKGKDLVGWQTDYADKKGTIHFWHTSHVLLFLMHYESLLRQKIGADGAEAAGLHVRRPTTLKHFKSYWQDEPLRSLGGSYAVLDRIEKEYLVPREKASANSHEPPRSLMLYGPPGTGKTTLAEQMAVRLGRPLIVVTVSDFLAAGSTEIENRAKGVFEILRAQEGVIILFDEIDQFLLDRNSEFYKIQSDVFKFMTPGMLTKLQDLREAEGSIFILATNYYERIDSAIKRRGRIDNHLLLSVPDREQRLKLINRFVTGVFKKRFKKDSLDATALDTALKKSDIAQVTALFAFGDLSHMVEVVADLKADMNPEVVASALIAAAPKVEPAVCLSAYRTRFEEKGPFAFEEFFLLVHLLAECDVTPEPADKDTINHVMRHVGTKGQGKEDMIRAFREREFVKDPAAKERVLKYIDAHVLDQLKDH